MCCEHLNIPVFYVILLQRSQREVAATHPLFLLIYRSNCHFRRTSGSRDFEILKIVRGLENGLERHGDMAKLCEYNTNRVRLETARVLVPFTSVTLRGASFRCLKSLSTEVMLPSAVLRARFRSRCHRKRKVSRKWHSMQRFPARKSAPKDSLEKTLVWLDTVRAPFKQPSH